MDTMRTECNKLQGELTGKNAVSSINKQPPFAAKAGRYLWASAKIFTAVSLGFLLNFVQQKIFAQSNKDDPAKFNYTVNYNAPPQVGDRTYYTEGTGPPDPKKIDPPKAKPTGATPVGGNAAESLWVGKKLFDSFEIVNGEIRVEHFRFEKKQVGVAISGTLSDSLADLYNISKEDIKRIVAADTVGNILTAYALIENETMGSAILGIGFDLDELEKVLNKDKGTKGIISLSDPIKMKDNSKILKNSIKIINRVVYYLSTTYFGYGKESDPNPQVFGTEFPDLTEERTGIRVDGNDYCIRDTELDKKFGMKVVAVYNTKTGKGGVYEDKTLAKK